MINEKFYYIELIIPWLGRWFWNQTFSDDLEIDIEEIRALIDDESGTDPYNGYVKGKML